MPPGSLEVDWHGFPNEKALVLYCYASDAFLDELRRFTPYADPVQLFEFTVVSGMMLHALPMFSDSSSFRCLKVLGGFRACHSSLLYTGTLDFPHITAI